MGSKKRLKVLSVLTTLTFLFSACSIDKLEQNDTEKRIMVIVKMDSGDFWPVVRMGAEAAGKEFGVNVSYAGPQEEDDIDGQIQLVKNAIDAKYDAIVIASCDYNRLVGITDKAASLKIPVIVIDSAINSNTVKSFIATDNIDAGAKAGEALVKYCGEDNDIAVMNFVKGAATAEQREEGFLKYIQQYPNIKVVSKEYCFSDEKLAEDLTRKVLDKNNNIDAFVCLNAYSTVGVAKAIKSLNLDERIKIIGFDSTPVETSLIEKGVIQATVIQNPFSMGYLGVKSAVAAIDGKSLPKFIDTGAKVIDKENMYYPENQKLVFPFVK